MSAARSDAATSTDDIVKGRPLCLFYFAHPFGVLSCEPPTVLAPAPPAPDHCAAPPSPPAPAPAPAGAMARRSPTWPVGACARRLPPYTRTLPPLKLPTPKDSSSVDGSDDVWSRSAFIPPERMSLPPIELPAPTPPAGEGRAGRGRRLGPVAAGVRKPAARSRGAALARLLRRAVATVVPLRAGCVCGAALGGAWACAHLAVYCAPAAAGAAALGARSEPLRRAHGALGVWLAAAHALLAAAALRSSRNLSELYVRVSPLLCAAAVLLLLAAVALATAEGRAALAALLVLVTIVLAPLSLYLTVIVDNFAATIRA